MANKLVIYNIEDQQTGKVYRIEGPEGATDEELNEFMLSQDFESKPSTVAAPPVTADTGTAYRPQPAIDIAEGSFGPQADTRTEAVQQGTQPMADIGLNAEEKAAVERMQADPSVPYEDIDQYIRGVAATRGTPYMSLGGSPEQLAEYRKALQEGAAPRGVEYEDWRTQIPREDVQPVEDPTWLDSLTRSYKDAVQYGVPGMVARGYHDWMDTGLEQLRQKFPDATPEQLEEMQSGLVTYTQRLLREKGAIESENDPMVPWLVGQLAGSAGVEDLVPLAKAGKLGTRLAQGAAVNIGSDIAYQNLDIAQGVQDEYNIDQTALSGILGAGLQIGAHGVGKGVDRLRGRAPEIEAEPTPEFKSKITAPEGTTRSKGYKEGLTKAVTDIDRHVTETVKDWSNVPEYEVHDSFKKLQGVDNKALGAVTPEGKVILNGEEILKTAKKAKVAPEDVVNAVTYHEMLGHHGLSQRFGEDLDGLLEDMYTSGISTFQRSVDDWMEANPDAYVGPDRHIRATEEVLAEMSEKGQLPVKLKDRILNFIKDYARRAGVSLKFSEREVKTILGMAHAATINGRGRDVSSNGFKFARVWHGSPHDFNEFDHSKMGSGEGAQVYGWGTYLTETKKVAEGYRNILSGSRPTWNKVEGSWVDTWNNLDADVKAKFPDLEPAEIEQVARGAFVKARDSDGRSRMRTAAEFLDYLGHNREDYESQESYFSHLKRLQPILDYVNEKLDVKSEGKLYEVEVPDNAQWLLWDETFDKQPEVIKEMFEGWERLSEKEFRGLSDRFYDAVDELDNINAQLSDDEWFRKHPHLAEASDLIPDEEFDRLFARRDELIAQKKSLQVALNSSINPQWTGEDLYDRFVKMFGSPRAASEALDTVGVAGNKYLDAFSRDAREGTYNYVVFNDKTPKVQNKYMREFKTTEADDISSAREIVTGALDAYEPTYRSWAEARRAAKDKGMTARQINKAKSVGELDKRIFQYDAAAQVTSERLAVLHAKLNSGQFTAKDKADYLKTVFEHNEMLGRIFDDQGEIGRALAAMRAIQHTRSKYGQLNEMLSEMEGNNLKGFADEENFLKFAMSVQGLMNSGNQKGALKMLPQVMKPYWWQYLLSFRHSMMLSGIGTHAKNAKDNAMMIARELEESALAMPLFAVRKLGRGKLAEGVSPQEVSGRLYGLLNAALDSTTYKDTWEAFQKGHENRQVSSKVEMADARIPVLSTVQDTLHAADTFFRAFHTNANMYALGVRKAREEGYTGLSAFEEGSNKAVNPTEELRTEAKRLTDVSLLVDTPSGLSAKLESVKAIRPGMSAGDQATAFTANLLFPFFRVTDRLLFQALRRSPLAFLDRVTREDLAAGGARMDIAIARMSYGSALMYYYWQQAGEDKVQGEGPADYKKRQALEAGGWMPNSVEKEDRYEDASALNLSWMPWNLQNNVAANIASIREAYDKKLATKEETAAALGSATLALGSILSSQSFAENISTYIAPFEANNEAQKDTAAANFVGGFASSFIPAALRQYNQAIHDPVKRDTTGDKSFTDRVYGRLASAIPGLSEQLPAKHDVYGDEMVQGRSISGIGNYRPTKDDPVSKELQRLERTTDKPVVVGAPSSFKHEGETIKLTAEGKQEWQRVQGYYLKMGMKDTIESEEWKAATDEDKIAIVKEIRTEAYELTKSYMLPLLGITEEEENPDTEEGEE